MSTSKISVSAGSVSFSGEGDQAWLTEQLEKVLKAAPGLAATAVRTETSSRRKSPDSVENETASCTTSLSAYIKEKGGESNQVDRFLISADWLRRRGNKQLTTAAVGKALVDN